jgi:hypothetical protein
VASKIYVLVLPVGGGFENSTCLKRAISFPELAILGKEREALG